MPPKWPTRKKTHYKASRPKKYGKVKPVRQIKSELKVEKPSTSELRGMYSRLKKAASWQINDILAEAVQWYRRMTAYLYAYAHHSGGKTATLMLARQTTLAKLMLRRDAVLKKAQASTDTLERQKLLLEALKLYTDEVTKMGVKVPSAGDALKKAKSSAKKLDERKAQVEKKFDATLTMLETAIDLDVSLGAVPVIVDANGLGQDFKFDPTLNKMMYSRVGLNEVKRRIRAEGLLPVLLEQVVFVAKSGAMKSSAKKTGLYIADPNEWVMQIGKGLKSICKYLSSNPDAPNKLIKRTVPRKQRTKKEKKQHPDAVAIAIQDAEAS